jgi:Flp pilus assembly protein TadG
VAVVELALVLPTMLALVLGTLAVGQVLYFRKSIVTATAEGLRIASNRSTTAADVEQCVTAILDARDIDGVSVDLTPTTIDGIAPGDMITLRVQAPFTSLGRDFFGSDLFPTTVTVEGYILRE